MALAQDAGPTDVPLMRQTIGENLAATVARYADEEALVVPYQNVRLTYREFAAEVKTRTGGIPVGYKLSAQHVEKDLDAALEIALLAAVGGQKSCEKDAQNDADSQGDSAG